MASLWCRTPEPSKGTVRTNCATQAVSASVAYGSGKKKELLPAVRDVVTFRHVSGRKSWITSSGRLGNGCWWRGAVCRWRQTLPRHIIVITA